MNQFLRNIGLGTLSEFPTWLRGLRYRRRCQRRAEQKKVVVSSSRRLAVSRCGVHIAPIMVSTAIIAVNLKQDFIGIDFLGVIHSETVNIALLQTAAKVQELLIVASLATIAFHLVRDELLYGEGIPLGLLGAGIEFSKLSFFWSREFIGGLRGFFGGSRRYRKLQLVVFLLLGGVISLLAGPACAVLLVPQIQDWPLGGTPISLNGTVDKFWPLKLTGDSFQSADCLSSNGTINGVCPSGGYRSLWSHYCNLDFATYATYVPPYAYQLSGNHYYWPIESMQPVLTRTISIGFPGLAVWMVQPHLSASIALDQLMKSWWQALLASGLYKDSQILDRAAASSYVYNPHVSVSCAPPKLLSSSNHTILFPVVDSQSFQSQDITGFPISDDPSNHLQFSWIHLNHSFGPITTGAVLQSAWDHDNNSRLVVGCSLSAHWVKAYLRSDAYSFWQGWYPKNLDFENPYPSYGSLLENGSTSTQGAIEVDESWLNALTPATPVAGPGYLDWKPTTIESILSVSRITEDLEGDSTISIDDWKTDHNGGRPGLFQSIIASIFADGLSRAGVEQLYTPQGIHPSQWILSPYEEHPDFDHLILSNERALNYPANDDMFRVDFRISGLNYSTSLAQKLAMMVLFLHIAFATSHSVWLIVRGKSSACWDSVTEIMVIAQNSKPAVRALENTAAGIQYSSTFSKKVAIRPTKPIDNEEASHLEFQMIEDEAEAESESIEMEPSNFEASQSARSSTVEIGEQSPETVRLLHPKTWHPGEGYGKTLPSLSTNLPHSGRLSVPGTTPQLPPSHTSGSSLRIAFKENAAYG